MRYIFYSIFGVDEDNKLSHTLIDDEFYINSLIENKKEFIYFTSCYTKTYIDNKRKCHIDSVQIAGKDKLLFKNNDVVIFNGFTEMHILKFIIKNILNIFLYNVKIKLISTNNLSLYRIKKFKYILKFFYYIFDIFNIKIIIHTKREKELLYDLNKSISCNSEIKIHHLMINRENKNYDFIKPVITFIGPTKHNKTIVNFLKLIKADSNKKFKFRIVGVDPSVLNIYESNDFYHEHDIEISYGKLSPSNFYNVYYTSTYIFLGHNKNFDGLLSGNFCDCISTSTPFISQRIYPYIDYLNDYGKICILFDASVEGWEKSVIKHCHSYKEHKISINDLSLSINKQLVIDSLFGSIS